MCPADWLRSRALRALPVLFAAVLVACTPRPSAPPAPPPPPPPTEAPSERALPPVPPSAPPPTPEKLTDTERDAVLFTQWRARHAAEVEAFESFLAYEKIADVVPTYQLLRSASMWKECKAEPFEIPPTAYWPMVRDVLLLLRELRDQQVLSRVEVVSAYRDPRLNRCAGGAPGSSHQRFAIDIAPLDDETGQRLCTFWRQQGQGWSMGMSRYPSGRIHIDRTAYRTWGASHKRGSSYCLQE